MAEEITEINCIGLRCPLPVMRMERALKAGKRHFLLIADDPVSVVDIPLALHKLDAQLKSQSHESGVYQFEIIKAST